MFTKATENNNMSRKTSQDMSQIHENTLKTLRMQTIQTIQTPLIKRDASSIPGWHCNFVKRIYRFDAILITSAVELFLFNWMNLFQGSSGKISQLSKTAKKIL